MTHHAYGLVVGTKDFEDAHCRAQRNQIFFFSSDNGSDKLYHCGILWRFEECVLLGHRMVLRSRSEDESDVCADGLKWIAGKHSNQATHIGGGGVEKPVVIGKDTFGNDVVINDLMEERKEKYCDKVAALPRNSDGVIDLVDATKVIRERDSEITDEVGKMMERRSDGIVSLLIFGNEKVMVTNERAVPSRVVTEGRDDAIQDLSFDFVGVKNRKGIKFFGEYVCDGVANFIYILPAILCPRIECHKWLTLNQALSMDDSHCVRFVIEMFPRFAMLTTHYFNLVDYSLIERQKRMLRDQGVTGIQLIRAILSDGPKKIENVVRWMSLLGYTKGDVEIRRGLKKSMSGIKVLSENGLLCLDSVFFMRHLGYSEDIGKEMTCIAPRDKDPFPLTVVCDIVQIGLMEFDLESVVSHIMGPVDTEIRRACEHGGCCDEYCRGPCRSHICEREVAKGRWRNTDGTNDMN